MQCDASVASTHSPRTFDADVRRNSRHTSSGRWCRCNRSLLRREPQHGTTRAISTTTRHLELHPPCREPTCAISDSAPLRTAGLAHHIHSERARVADEYQHCTTLRNARRDATRISSRDAHCSGDHEFETVECCSKHLCGSHTGTVRCRLPRALGGADVDPHQTIERYPPLGCGRQSESWRTNHTDPRARLRGLCAQRHRHRPRHGPDAAHHCATTQSATGKQCGEIGMQWQ